MSLGFGSGEGLEIDGALKTWCIPSDFQIKTQLNKVAIRRPGGEMGCQFKYVNTTLDD